RAARPRHGLPRRGFRSSGAPHAGRSLPRHRAHGPARRPKLHRAHSARRDRRPAVAAARQGRHGHEWRRPGRPLLQIHLEPHPLYRVSGHDLDLEVPLAPWEAALGAQVDIPTMTGRVTMKVPPGSKAGQKLRLAGKGLPQPGGGAGDLYAVLSIEAPNPLTEPEKKLFEELRSVSRFNPRARFGA